MAANLRSLSLHHRSQPLEPSRDVMRVLIVDDSPVSRELVRDILEPNGHEVFEAPDGAAALRKIEETRPHVVLLDIEMPQFDGYEVIRRLRKDPRFAALR